VKAAGDAGKEDEQIVGDLLASTPSIGSTPAGVESYGPGRRGAAYFVTARYATQAAKAIVMTTKIPNPIPSDSVISGMGSS
jgi:hypothetical protein